MTQAAIKSTTGSQGTLIGNTVRVNSNHRPSKVGSSRDSTNGYSVNQYGMITANSSYIRPSTNINKTAEQSYRKSNNYLVVGGASGVQIEETT